MYQVVDTKTKTAVAIGFKNREDAKVDRDARNGGKTEGKLKFIVSRCLPPLRGPSFGPVTNHSKRWL